MRSIDNLREWWQDRFPVMDRQLGRDFREHIDAIEREVEEVRDREYRNGMEDGEMAAERDGWVRMPVDADGVPIHVGDVMDWVDEPGITRTVTSIQFANDGWWVYINGTGRRPDKYRHHHAPTVEDVLAEMLDAWGELPSNVTNEAIIAEYAAKLRLANNEE